MKKNWYIIVGLVLIGVAACAEPIRSLVASAQESRTEEGELATDAYVQDGLVAMWDGIVRPGNNLVGGQGDFSLYPSEIGNNSINVLRRIVATLPYDFCQMYDIGSIFVTCRLVNRAHASKSVFMFPNPNGTSSSVGVYSWNNSIPIRMFRGVNWRNTITESEWPEDDEFTGAFGIVFSTKKGTESPYNVFKAYLDDDLTYSLTGDNWSFNYDFGGLSNSQLALGAEGYELSIYNVRIYNRELTAEEIAYNFQIDKERFGL